LPFGAQRAASEAKPCSWKLAIAYTAGNNFFELK
jgi:hypothetical protein